MRGKKNLITLSVYWLFQNYEGFLHRYPESFFADEDRMQIDLLDKIRSDFRGHLRFLRDPIHFGDANISLSLMIQLKLKMFKRPNNRIKCEIRRNIWTGFTKKKINDKSNPLYVYCF